MSKATTNLTPSPKYVRNPRFERSAGIRFILQSRDVEIIHQVYKHLFLNSRQIIALIGGSESRLLLRLKHLFHSGYLDRPRQQIKPFSRQGSSPMVYALGNKGAILLARELGIPRKAIDWTACNYRVKQLHIEHTLMVAHFMVCVELACRKYSYADLIGQDRILRSLREYSGVPAARDKRPNVFRMKIISTRQIRGKNRKFKLSIIPDKVFGLHFPKDPPGRNRIFYFLEADRTTMPIMRSNPHASSYFKKMQAYWEVWRQNEYKKIFGTRSVRVLTLAKSEERIKNMIKACKLVDRRQEGSRLFWFAQDSEFSLDHPTNILDEVWQNGRDDKRMSMVL